MCQQQLSSANEPLQTQYCHRIVNVLLTKLSLTGSVKQYSLRVLPMVVLRTLAGEGAGKSQATGSKRAGASGHL